MRHLRGLGCAVLTALSIGACGMDPQDSAEESSDTDSAGLTTNGVSAVLATSSDWGAGF